MDSIESVEYLPITADGCYGPSVISVTVTKGGHLRGSRLYRTSRTIERGVTESCKKFST